MTNILKALAAELDEMGGRAGAIDTDELPDLTSDDFRLISPIGGGGMGSVYMAEQISLAAFVAALAVGYLHKSRSLEAVHQEAARASWSLVEAMTKFDRSEDDPRDTELRRAEEIAQRLAERFPEDESMKAAVEEIRKTRERRAHSMKTRRWRERLP